MLTSIAPVAAPCAQPAYRPTHEVEAPASAVIADASPLLRLALGELLLAEFGLADIYDAQDYSGALAMARAASAPLVFLDWSLIAGRSGGAVARMCENAPGCLLVVLAAHADENLAASWIDNGACAVLDKKLERDKFRESIGLILQGEKLISIVDNRRPYGAIDFNRAAMWAAELRPRQKEVLRLIGRGLKDREIANAMGLCEPTVRHHVRATKAALQLTTRTKTALCANWLDAKGLL
jgi:two-component system response regulator DevR